MSNSNFNKSQINLSAESGDKIKKIIDKIIDVIVVLTTDKKNNGK